MIRDQSSLSSRLLDLVCLAVLGLLLTFLASVIARATGPAPVAAGAHAASTAGTSVSAGAGTGTQPAADCDTPAKPDAPAAAAAAAGGAPVKTGETVMAGGLPSSMSVGACADGSDKPAAAPAAAGDAAQPHH